MEPKLYTLRLRIRRVPSEPVIVNIANSVTQAMYERKSNSCKQTPIV